jgi:hypothetical protein
VAQADKVLIDEERWQTVVPDGAANGLVADETIPHKKA